MNAVYQEYNYILQVMQKAQQIASGFYYTRELRTTPTDLRHNPKLDLLVELITELLGEDPNRQIIIWRAYRHEDNLISDRLILHNLSHVIGPDRHALGCFAPLLTHSLTAPPSIIIMPIQTSEGFNELIGADTNIFYSNSYSQNSRAQAEARINRQGQASSIVTHIDLCTPGGADEAIVIALQSKQLTKERLTTIVRDRHNAYN